MSAFDPAVEAICPACDRKRTQKRVFDGGKIQHLCCESCGAVHAYSAGDPDAKPASEAGIRVLELTSLRELLGAGSARPYSASESFRAGELIGHPKFDIGYVMTVLSAGNKMQVLFGDKRRVLVCKLDLVARAREAEAKHPAPVQPPRKPAPRRRPKPRPRSEPEPVSSAAPPQKQGPVSCPRCGRSVHPFNVLQTPAGEPAGCMYCRG